MWVVSGDGELLCFQNVLPGASRAARERGEMGLTVTGCVLEGSLGGHMELFWASMDVDGRGGAGTGSEVASARGEERGEAERVEAAAGGVAEEEEEEAARGDESEDDEDGELRRGPWRMGRGEVERRSKRR